MISTTTYYKYLASLVYNCVYEFWLRNQAETLNKILVRKKIVLKLELIKKKLFSIIKTTQTKV